MKNRETYAESFEVGEWWAGLSIPQRKYVLRWIEAHPCPADWQDSPLAWYFLEGPAVLGVVPSER